MFKKIKAVFSILAIVLFAVDANAQTRISAPYTIFGLGDIQNQKNSGFLSIQGASNALYDPFIININNPASYSAFNSRSFLFEANISGTVVKQSSNTASQNHTYISPGDVRFGFPVAKNLGASFGYIPYSKVGYNVLNTVVSPTLGSIDYTYEGFGGLNNLYLGTGYKINENIALGVNANYFIGNIKKINKVNFLTDTITTYGMRETYSLYPNGFNITGGIHLSKEIKKDLKIMLGVSYQSSAKLKFEERDVIETFESEYDNKDTIMDITEKKKLDIPQRITIGIGLDKKEEWSITADYTTQNWNNYKYDGETDKHLGAYNNFAMGGKFIPDKYAMKGFLKRMEYSTGFRYSTNYILVNDKPFNEYGISFGLGLPLYKKNIGSSLLSMGIEIGERGNLEKNNYKENFTNFVLSLKIYEFWFIKRKYD